MRVIDPVLLCNDLGTRRDPKRPGAIVRSNGHASLSVKEAVRVAQSNNFMGLMCNSRLLVCLYYCALISIPDLQFSIFAIVIIASALIHY